VRIEPRTSIIIIEKTFLHLPILGKGIDPARFCVIILVLLLGVAAKAPGGCVRSWDYSDPAQQRKLGPIIVRE
jgi:hypothetical protein